MITDVKKLPIQFDRDRVVAFCRDRGIVRLSVFGSVLRDDFDPARSDIDVLADFKPEATRGIGFRFFGYGDELAGILGHRVAFCSQFGPTSRADRSPRSCHDLRGIMSRRDPRITLVQIRDEA